MLALLDVGRTPVNLALKPDGGELMVCDFDSNSISIVETGNDEVGSSVVVGQHPARGMVTRDNSRLYISNFGSDSVAVYDIDLGRRIATLAVGSDRRVSHSPRMKTISWCSIHKRRCHGDSAAHSAQA